MPTRTVVARDSRSARARSVSRHQHPTERRANRQDLLHSGYPFGVTSSPEVSPSLDDLTGLGQVEYRLARDQSVREYRRGRLSRHDVCDAHTELLRVGTNLGRETEVECPICEQARLRHVIFAFGPSLPPGGRAIGTTKELRQLARALRSEVAFYVVEVCLECRWNHLVRMFSSVTAKRRMPLGKAPKGARRGERSKSR